MMKTVMKMVKLEWPHSTGNSKDTAGTVDRWDTKPLNAPKMTMESTGSKEATTTTAEEAEASEDTKVEHTMEDTTTMEEVDAAEAEATGLPNSKANATTVESLATRSLNVNKEEVVELTLEMLPLMEK